MAALSKRLKLIFNHLIPGLPVWDICCDHGYLGSEAYKSKHFPEVVFVDQVPEIINRLKEKFQITDDNQTTCRFIPIAAESLTVPLTGNVVISGVGSFTIFQILKSLQDRNLLKAQRLILCPQNDVVKMDAIKKMPDFLYRQSLETLSVMEKDRKREIYILDQTPTHI